MNPCPCGHLGDPRHDCRCPPPLVERYRAWISGPLLGRIDLHVEVPAVSLRELRAEPGERSEKVAERVGRARAIQRRRFGDKTSTPTNAAMGPEDLQRYCVLEDSARQLLDTAFKKLGFSARAMARVLKVSRTIVDLAESEKVGSAHVGEAIQYRSLDRRLGQ